MIKWLKRKIFGEKLENHHVYFPIPKEPIAPARSDTLNQLRRKRSEFRPKESSYENYTPRDNNCLTGDLLSPLNPTGPFGPIIDAGHIWRSPEPSPSSTDSSHSQHHTPSHSSSHDHSSYDSGGSSYDSGGSSDCGTSSDSGSSGCDGC